MYKKTLGIVVLLVLSAQFLPCASEDGYMEWTFEPRTDRSLSVTLVDTLERGTTSYSIVGLSRELWIRNLRTYEYLSGDEIESELTYDSETDTQSIDLTFDDPVPEGFQAVIEFDASDYLEEEAEKTFIFYWGFGTYRETAHSAKVILPKDAELLEVDLANPTKVEEKEQVTVYYKGTSDEDVSFEFELTFSSSGKSYISLAERYEEGGQYDQAISQYQKAKSFYNRFNLYRRDKSTILGELQEKIYAIQKIQADTAFQDGMDAFNEKNYETAQEHFEKAETLYTTIKDAEGEAACREMTDEIERIGELRKEADSLLEQGKTQFDGEQYELAQESFNQARQKYEELGDTQKVSECDEWITKCTEAAGLGTILVVLGVALGLLLKRFFSS